MTQPRSVAAHDYDAKPRTGDVVVETEKETRFSSLFLSPRLTEGLAAAGFVRPSPIQLKAIPLGRCGLDMIVQAKSGTGKTCVFAVVALEGLLSSASSSDGASESSSTCSDARLQALMLAPTREIAVQIRDVIEAIAKTTMPEIKIHAFIGGLSTKNDLAKLRAGSSSGSADGGDSGGPHIAVGSPGRVKALIECGAMATESIRLLVFDEADKLFDDSFNEDINWIYSRLPDNKQVLALSATYPEYMAQSLQLYMRNPTFCRLDAHQPVLIGLRQFFHLLPTKPSAGLILQAKTQALVDVISHVGFNQCLVFSNLQSQAQHLATLLSAKGWPTAHISGSQEQQTRLFAISRLKQMQIRVLVTTDLTARGVDVENVNLIVNLDVPADPETYLHRIGRAGRFGSYGVAVTLASRGVEEQNLLRIMNEYQMPLLPLPETAADGTRDGGATPPHDLLTNADYWRREDLDDQSEKLRLGERCRGFVATKPASASSTRKKFKSHDNKTGVRQGELAAKELNGGEERHPPRKGGSIHYPTTRAKGKENDPFPSNRKPTRKTTTMATEETPPPVDRLKIADITSVHSQRLDENTCTGPEHAPLPLRLPKLVEKHPGRRSRPFPSLEDLRRDRGLFVDKRGAQSEEERRAEVKKLFAESFELGKVGFDSLPGDCRRLRKVLDEFGKDAGMKWSPTNLRPNPVEGGATKEKAAESQAQSPRHFVGEAIAKEKSSKLFSAAGVRDVPPSAVDQRSSASRATDARGSTVSPMERSRGSAKPPSFTQVFGRTRVAKKVDSLVDEKDVQFRVKDGGVYHEEEEEAAAAFVGKSSVVADRMDESPSEEDSPSECEYDSEYDTEYDSESEEEYGTDEEDTEGDSEYESGSAQSASETTSQSDHETITAAKAGWNPYRLGPAPSPMYGPPFCHGPQAPCYGMPPAFFGVPHVCGAPSLYGMTGGISPHHCGVANFTYGMPQPFGAPTVFPYPYTPFPTSFTLAEPMLDSYQRQHLKFRAEFKKQHSFIVNSVKAYGRFSRRE